MYKRFFVTIYSNESRSIYNNLLKVFLLNIFNLIYNCFFFLIVKNLYLLRKEYIYLCLD